MKGGKYPRFQWYLFLQILKGQVMAPLFGADERPALFFLNLKIYQNEKILKYLAYALVLIIVISALFAFYFVQNVMLILKKSILYTC